MRTMSITFSPTGGTKKVTDLIAAEFSGEKTDVSLLPKKENYSEIIISQDDICIIAVPSFGGRVPGTAVSRILQMNGNGAKCILVCVYGNRAYEDTLLELKNTVKKAGFLPVAAITAIAEHSIMHQYAAGRPNMEDQKQIQIFARQIAEKLEKHELDCEVEVPGNETYREYGGVPFVPKATRKCISCAVCANECPVGAIDRKAPRNTDNGKCIACMRCITVCPEHARKLNEAIVLVAAKKMEKAFKERKECELFV